MPHNAYEKDGKRTRGSWVQGATYLWTAQRGLPATRSPTSTAPAAVLDGVFAERDARAAPDKKRLGDELVRARLELAAALEAGRGLPAAADRGDGARDQAGDAGTTA